MMASPASHPFTMDGHIDALYYAQAHGGGDSFLSSDESAQAGLRGLRRGQIDAAFFAIFPQAEIPVEHDPAAAAIEVDALMAGYSAWVAAGDPMRAIRSAADLEQIAGAGENRDPAPPFGVLIHCEGARGIRDLAHLHQLHVQGLRSVGLTWNHGNAYAWGAEEDPDAGLTGAGRELVRALDALHMVIDAAHLNRQGFTDLLALAQGPVVVTHTACAALFPHPRCVTDDQIRAIAERDGLLGVFYANKFLAPAGARVTIDTVLDHYEHLIEVAGVAHVALGTDFGGIDSGLPEHLTRAADLPNLFAGFAARGYSAADIAAIRGGNYRRVLGQILD
jgi:membrane dipeptidase